MTVTRAIILAVLLCTVVLTATLSIRAWAGPNSPSIVRKEQEQRDQNQALRDDLAKMKSLVEQMEMNLAFVDTTQSPLKHQFQLEIAMWRTTINQMERRLQQGHVSQK